MRKAIALCTVLLSVSACTEANSSAEIDEIQQSLADLELSVDSLRSRHLFDDLIERAQGSVSLDPADQGFAVLDSRYGPLTFQIDDVTPFADGSRVTLRIGNLTTATINGGSFTAEYGPRYTEDDEYEEWQETQRMSEISFPDDIRSGYWNEIGISLPGIPPTDLGRILIDSVDLSSITLRSP